MREHSNSSKTVRRSHSSPRALTFFASFSSALPASSKSTRFFSIVWKDVAVTDNALTRLVTHIRKVLQDDPKTPQYIETIATRGYRFIAAVTHAADRATTTENFARPISVAHEPTTSKRIRGFPLSYAVVGALVVLSTAALISSRLAQRSRGRDMVDRGWHS